MSRSTSASIAMVILFLSSSGCGSSGDGTGGGANGSTGSGTPQPTGNVTSIDAGRYHTCFSMKSGAVYCFGQGAYGALGNDGSYRGLPTKALVIDDATDVHCGGRFTCARRADKTLFCWGEDQAGQLGGPDTKPCGDAEIDSVCAPVPQIVSGIDDARGIALGQDHACALLPDGTVSCWGDNAAGQLGNATLMAQMTPTPVAGVEGATQVAAGDAHTCALIGSPGKVMCWGKNENGQVGSGEVTPNETMPVEVDGVTDAVEIAAGGEHTCARRQSGAIQCWGYNYFGQIGNGSKQPTRASSPIDVDGVSDAVELALGRYHTCARHAGGGIACWGYNSKGELGDGSSDDQQSPVEVTGISDAVAITAGAWHTCAILASGPVMCWGDDLGGQLGIDEVNKVENPTPVAVKSLPKE
ncbi:BNR repeat domain protein [Minicystis rosea]|nr:BNR repeat domain protein [Minicystis rosea]